MRLFVSVDLPDEFAPAVEAIQDDLRDAPGLNFTNPDQIHVTLKFLGEVEEDRLPALEEALSAAIDTATVEPFDATYAGLGAFPSEDYIRVVWLGVEDGGEELTRLYEAIEERTTSLGFEPEERDFTPHATIARMEHAGGKERVQSALRTRPEVGTTRVEEICLKESSLGPDGPEYSTLTAFEL